jgi:hypothetical protein
MDAPEVPLELWEYLAGALNGEGYRNLSHTSSSLHALLNRPHSMCRARAKNFAESALCEDHPDRAACGRSMAVATFPEACQPVFPASQKLSEAEVHAGRARAARLGHKGTLRQLPKTSMKDNRPAFTAMLWWEGLDAAQLVLAYKDSHKAKFMEQLAIAGRHGRDDVITAILEGLGEERRGTYTSSEIVFLASLLQPQAVARLFSDHARYTAYIDGASAVTSAGSLLNLKPALAYLLRTLPDAMLQRALDDAGRNLVDIAAAAHERSLALHLDHHTFPTGDDDLAYGARLVRAFARLRGRPPIVDLHAMLQSEATGALDMLLNADPAMLPTNFLSGEPGRRVLRMVVDRGANGLMKTLIARGPARGLEFAWEGDTVLHLSAAAGNREQVAMLVEAAKAKAIDLDTNAENADGKLALELMCL